MRYLAFNWNREKDISLAETYKSKVVFVDLIKQILFQFFLMYQKIPKVDLAHHRRTIGRKRPPT